MAPIKRTVKKLLEKIYYDIQHPAAYGTSRQLYIAAKKIQKTLTLQQVEEFLQKQPAYTLHRPVKHKFPRRKTIARGIDTIWQADLVSLLPIRRENSGYGYILTIIDVFSRFAFAAALKKKTAGEVATAFKKILKMSKRRPLKLHTDFGGEFYGKPFKNFLRENKIIHYSTHSDTKAAVVERLNRTLKGRMFKYFSAKNTLRYIDILPSLVDAYNNRYHTSLGRKRSPAAVNKRNEKEVRTFLYGDNAERGRKPLAKRSKFKVNDTVRITKLRRAFRKGYLKGWTDEVFTVVEVLDTVPVTYRLSDSAGEILQGIFYSEEMTKVIF